MDSLILNPVEDFEKKFSPLHSENIIKFFNQLTEQSGIDIQLNRETVAKHLELKENLSEIKKKYNWYRFLRVLACITLVLIPLVVKKLTPTIKELRATIENTDKTISDLLAQAQEQMQPLNSLFTDRVCFDIIQATIPNVTFEDFFSVNQQENMRTNYDYDAFGTTEDSTLDVLAGNFNENPFVFEKRIIHSMGTETYHGYKTIHWTETYVDSEGEVRTRSKSDTLHATVTKPKPFYSTGIVLNYCAQAAPDLCFSRDASHLDRKNDKQFERFVRRGERRLQRKSDRAVRSESSFTAMSNSEFEVVFDALDRTDEVQFRALFSPLAQTNMVSLIRSEVGFGDDFDFVKYRRNNRIFTEHSQGRELSIAASEYMSYSFDEAREKFINKNKVFFKAVYFDFAPIWAIPDYQSRPVHSLDPIPNYTARFSVKECETMANIMPSVYAAHPQSKTPAILKSSYVGTYGDVDETCITAYSYDIAKRVDYVSVYGGDGNYHDVPVEWDEYIPLVASNNFYIASESVALGKNVYARRNGLCIFN